MSRYICVARPKGREIVTEVNKMLNGTRSFRAWMLGTAIALLLFTEASRSQIAISGMVTDSKGRFLPAATITASGNEQAFVVSDSIGRFRLLLLPRVKVTDQVTIHAERKGYAAYIATVQASTREIAVKLIPNSTPSTNDVVTATSKSLNQVDSFYRPLAGFQRGNRQAIDPGAFPVSSQQNAAGLRFYRDGQPLTTITYADFAKLSPDSQLLLLAMEDSMTNHYNAWIALYRKRSEPSVTPTQLADIDDHLQESGTEMCKDLTGILDYITSLSFQLEDHYQSVRWVCHTFTENAQLNNKAGGSQ